MGIAKNKGGFTLIETMIALLILCIGMLGMLPVLAGTIRGNSFGGTMTESATWSQDKLETLRQEAFDDLKSRAANGLETEDIPEAGLTRGWIVTETCSGCGDIYTIEVCTAETAEFSEKCFTDPPVESRHFLGVRADF